jgi:predicted O-methyltransferase YrrM
MCRGRLFVQSRADAASRLIRKPMQTSKLKSLLKSTPGVYPAYRTLKRCYYAARSVTSPFLRPVPAGHFYSPLADMRQVRAQRESLFDRTVTECPGVDLRAEQQLAMLDEMGRFYGDVPFPETESNGTRYYYQNSFFSRGDAIVLFAMLRRLRPKRVMEVGSGFSSAVMLDTNDRFLEGGIEFTFIDPFPNRLLRLLSETDARRHTVLRKSVQDIALHEFDVLQSGDVLFIDSSHVVKIGSDVRHLLWHVLPRLRAGVVVHFHDVLWPFEYPQDWVLGGTAWNEAYFLRTFLQYNSVFQIEYFNSYVAHVHERMLRERMPMCLQNPGGSLWLRKMA